MKTSYLIAQRLNDSDATDAPAAATSADFDATGEPAVVVHGRMRAARRPRRGGVRPIAAVLPTVTSSRSQRATVFGATPTRSANSRWVRPSALRAARTSSPVMEGHILEV